MLLNSKNKKFPNLAICLILLISMVSPIKGWCASWGWNPSFKGAPMVSQVTSTSVLVSWKDIVETRECADQFLVKYWRTRTPKNYIMSDLVSAELNSVILAEIEPAIEYTYQVIAREDKSLGRIDYTRSPMTKFRAAPNFGHKSNVDGVNVARGHKIGKKYNIMSKIIQPKHKEIPPTPDNTIVNRIGNGGSKLMADQSQHSDVKEQNGISLIIANPATIAFLIVGGLLIGLLLVGITYSFFKRVRNRQKSSPGVLLKSTAPQENSYIAQPLDDPEKSTNTCLSASEDHKRSSSDTIKASTLNGATEEKTL